MVVVTVIASGVGSKADADATSSPVEAPLSADEKAVLRKRKYVLACLFGNLTDMYRKRKETAAVSKYKHRTALHGPTWQAKSMVSSLGGMQINILAHRMQPPTAVRRRTGGGGR